MDYNLVWEKALKGASNGLELKTKRGKWFHLLSFGDKLIIAASSTNHPSIQITSTRTVGKKEFITVSTYYYNWSKGIIGTRTEAANASRNTSYIFSIIKYFL